MNTTFSLLFILSVYVSVSTGFFFGTKKPVDGCNPDPCKNNAVCELLSVNKMLSMCDCKPGFHGRICDKRTGCYKNPCKHGTCRDDSRDPSKYHCSCEHGYVGTNCDIKNQCVAKNPCKGESVCSLDSKFNAVCECPVGFTYGRSSCDKRNCTVVQFKGANFDRDDVYIAAEVKKSFEKLDGLAKLCEVRIKPEKSFVLQQNPRMVADPANAAFYVGRALGFILNDAKTGNLLCDKECLGKFPIPDKKASCFVKGLTAIGWKYSSTYPGETNDGFHLADHLAYNKQKDLKQIGCELEKNFPKSNYVVLDSNSLIHCPQGKAGIRCNKVNLCESSKNPCRKQKGTVCELDAKFDPICRCKEGFAGKNCEQRVCTIIEFRGKNFEKQPKVLIDASRKNLFEDLDDLAFRCEVIIAPIRSFTLQSNVNDSSIGRDSTFYVGRGLEFELHDRKGRLLCNSFCLGKYPLPMAQAKCFVEGLSAITWKHSVFAPGLIHDGSHIFNPDEYNKARAEKQNGCKLTKL